ncbi:hypothetical protein ACN2XU_22795 [Primorskyibacter sp. 2E107]|uniref:hypothetical protein n=1 Tax=Primorskyibacter sp. 2E107 TaxID=3403458 RepID=UPI003AF43031
MDFYAIDSLSLSPVITQDASVLNLQPTEEGITAKLTCYLQSPCDVEVDAFCKGKIQIGVVNLTGSEGTMPSIVFKMGRVLLHAAYALGAEAPELRAALVAALETAEMPDDQTTWPIVMELVDTRHHVTKGLRMIGPNPRIWASFVRGLQGSQGVELCAQERMLQACYLRFPTNQSLLKAAPVTQIFR